LTRVLPAIREKGDHLFTASAHIDVGGVLTPARLPLTFEQFF
jgi:hypothetical protein